MAVYNNMDVINKIISYEPNLTTLEKKFIQIFYAHTSNEDLNNYQHKQLLVFARNAFNTIANKKSSAEIRVFNSNESEHGWNGNATIIEVHHEDIPFLLDSISGILHTRGYKISQVIHPVIRCKRDQDGNLIDLVSDNEKSSKDFTPESFLQFHLYSLENEEGIEKLKHIIANVLENVKITVADWKPMLSRAEQLIKEFDMSDEAKALIEWVKNDNFIFMAYARNDKGNIDRESCLGITKLNDRDLFNEIITENHFLLNSNPEINITKIKYISPVHKSVNLDLICINPNGSDTTYNFVGLFTSGVHYQSVFTIPFVRQKIDYVLKTSGFRPASHNYKEIVAIIEAFPRDELLQISQELLYEDALEILSLHERHKVKLFVHPSLSERFISFIIFIPRERFSDKLCADIQEMLELEYDGKIDKDYLHLNESRLARYHLIMNVDSQNFKKINKDAIEAKIVGMTSFWDDDSKNELIKHFGFEQGSEYYELYKKAFPKAYQELFGTAFLTQDITTFENSIAKNSVFFEIYQNEEVNYFDLKIYSNEERLSISALMPILDNLGFLTQDSMTFEINRSKTSQPLILHYFRVYSDKIDVSNFDNYKRNFEELLINIWYGKIKNDKFISLAISANIHPREVMLMKAIAKYLKQININYHPNFIASVLDSYANLTNKLVKLFGYRFSPTYHNAVEFEKTLAYLNQEIANISNNTEYKILQYYIHFITCTIRTNFYQKDEHDSPKEYMSFKIQSGNIPEIPLPKPFMEIFVYNTYVEGIHLRGGPVSRGGLRLSDRHDDYRTEVLGLLKTQMAKNSIIVPVGSKGSFIVKRQILGATREQINEENLMAYKIFLKGILDITDNIIDDKIVPPKDVVKHDEDDPYMVVAADKGTATFSDTANSISKEYNFWLGDAFASGGSNGYDHKKMGITARGGWVCVIRHFQELGIDVFNEEFTAVGIGDMAGDVFGNFMLLSDNIKLIAAFNHMHIFVDPNPDAKKSYQERKRLFTTPRTTWDDYDRSILSKGGMIYERNAKSVTLTPEIKEVLDIEEDVITTDALIKAVLSAPVDLLWNGGIGTYVKAKEEHPEHVGDKNNDNVRVNGQDLRCKIVGEGGNLGFTQRGRIEYALKGGRINTDAIDNSAGVDCSDHEVNIKIGFGNLIRTGKITLEERNQLLEAMTDEVTKLVTNNNRDQSLAISMEHSNAANLITEHGIIIDILERERLLDRAIEFLPSNKEIEMRGANKLGLTRPEIAILCSYSKMSIYNKLIKTNIGNEDRFIDILKAYFPEKMQKQYDQLIIEHPLRKEIITTIITNTIVNKLGISFFHLTMEETECEIEDFVEAFIASYNMFNIEKIWNEIDSLPFNRNIYNQKTSMLKIIQNLLHTAIVWFIHNIPKKEIEFVIKEYSKILEEFIECAKNPEYSKIYDSYNHEFTELLNIGVEEKLATKIAELNILSLSFSLIKFCKATNLPLENAIKLYFLIDEAIEIMWLKDIALCITTNNFWDRTAVKALSQELDQLQLKLALSVINISKGDNIEDQYNKWIMDNELSIHKYHDFLTQVKKDNIIDPTILYVATSRIKSLFDTN